MWPKAAVHCGPTASVTDKAVHPLTSKYPKRHRPIPGMDIEEGGQALMLVGSSTF